MKKTHRKRKWALAALIIAIAVVALSFALQRRILFPRHLAPLPDGDPVAALKQQSNIDFKLLTMSHADGKTEAWLFRDTSRPARGLVLYTHGNGETIDDLPYLLMP